MFVACLVLPLVGDLAVHNHVGGTASALRVSGLRGELEVKVVRGYMSASVQGDMLAYVLPCWYHMKECQSKFQLDFLFANGAGYPLSHFIRGEGQGP